MFRRPEYVRRLASTIFFQKNREVRLFGGQCGYSEVNGTLLRLYSHLTLYWWRTDATKMFLNPYAAAG